MKLGLRLRMFALTAFGELNKFSTAIGTSPAVLSQWLGDIKMPSCQYLERIYRSGCNINWLLSGEGIMLADNEAGKMLKNDGAMQNTVSDYHENPGETATIPHITDLRVLLKEDIEEIINKCLDERMKK
jgi:hypothetical protein